MKEQCHLKTIHRTYLADMHTPVGIYLRLRDRYAGSILLESSDYHAKENSFSYICCAPTGRFELRNKSITINLPNQKPQKQNLSKDWTLPQALKSFANSFVQEENKLPFISNGLFGYQAYDTVKHYEKVDIEYQENAIPDVIYQSFRFVIAINHFNNELHLFEHLPEGEESSMDSFETYVLGGHTPVFGFKRTGEEKSNFSDEGFMGILEKAKEHCQRGDVFQMVLSRNFEHGFQGDEFNVYRALRAINPSPYLFYFDYGNFKLFGSSPEAQIIVDKNSAEIHPIAGTFKRTGDDEKDAQLARDLAADPKENAEHVMLVDLARNDLSRHGKNVEVETYREVQFFSHVIHLVSKVKATINPEDALQLVGDTFPAGTLSGAPKHRAMQLINQYENQNRGFYGGCIGYLGFNGSFNHAIMIRSFMSRENTLYYQAGAGVVVRSNTQSESDEVHNKLRALKKALEMAEKI